MGRIIRRSFIVFLYTIVAVSCGELFSQTNYIMRLANAINVNSQTIEFDVYIKSNGSDFTLTSYQCTFSFTQSIINNGNISFSYMSGTSQFSNLPPTVSIGIQNNNAAYILTFASIPPDQETITSTEEKVGRFRLSNTTSFTVNRFNILWYFTGNAPTMLTGSGFTNITDRNNHINLWEIEIFPLSVSKDPIPEQYSLEQNYPNPFNPGTTIGFSVPEDVNNVKLTIYDALGQKIIELVNSNLEPGKYSYYWDAKNAASGLYIYELRTESATGGFVSTKKMLMIK